MARRRRFSEPRSSIDTWAGYGLGSPVICLSLRRQLRERLLQRVDEQIGVVVRERHRWADLHHVVIWPVRSEQHSPFSHSIHHERRLGAGRLEGLAIAHQLDAEEKAR